MRIKYTLFALGLALGLAHYANWVAVKTASAERAEAMQAASDAVLDIAERRLDQRAALVVLKCVAEGRSDCNVQVAQ